MRIGLAGLAALLALGWHFTRPAPTLPPETRAAVPAPTLAVPPSTLAPVARPSRLPTAPAPGASAAARAPGVSKPRTFAIDDSLAEPIIVEAHGMFSKLYENWDAEAEDKQATAEANAFFDTAFTTFDIQPEAGQLKCGDTLCRASFKFESQQELYKMNQIQEADGVRVATTFPQPDGNSFKVSIYWTRKENPEGSLTMNGGR